MLDVDWRGNLEEGRSPGCRLVTAGLDHQITPEELTDAVNELKSRKACGLDNIRAEMLKFSPTVMQKN